MNKKDLLLRLKYNIERQCKSDIGPIIIQKVVKLDNLYLVYMMIYFGGYEYAEIVESKDYICPKFILNEIDDYKEYDDVCTKIRDMGQFKSILKINS